MVCLTFPSTTLPNFMSLSLYIFIYLSLSNYAYHSHFLGEGEVGDKQKFVLWQTFIQLAFSATSSNPFTLFQGFSHRGWLFLSALFSLLPLLCTAPSASSERSLIYQILTQMAHKKRAVTVSLLCNPWINSQGLVLNPRYIRTQVRLLVLFV